MQIKITESNLELFLLVSFPFIWGTAHISGSNMTNHQKPQEQRRSSHNDNSNLELKK